MGQNSDLSDRELQAIRDELYALADVMIESYARRATKRPEESSKLESFIGTELQDTFLENVA